MTMLARLLAATTGVFAAAAWAAPSACPDGAKAMVAGYFDHTGAWYRRQTNIGPEQTAAQAWKAPEQGGIVILYNDIASPKAEADSPPELETLRNRIDARTRDITTYLDTARENGKIRVHLQLPQDLVLHWDREPGARELLRAFVKRYAGHPALGGFYLFDEPELSGISAKTLGDVASVVRKAAPGKALSISVASSAVNEGKPLLRAYASAPAPVFDELLVNRYPIYRAYGGGKDAAMGNKLGLSVEKAARENLRDNEFQNLDDYYDSLVAATRIPGLEGRPVYASMQAFGLRDDCDGPDCKAIKERRARRSPTWDELLYMYSAVWMSGMDGAVLYARYFSLYDKALRARLDNLETLMGPVFGALPGCSGELTVRRTSGGRKPGAWAPTDVVARLATPPGASRPEYLVVLHSANARQAVSIGLGDVRDAVAVDELRFDGRGNTLEPERRPLGRDGATLQLDLEGFGAKLFRLRYE
jgi:hypothetical protein